MATLVVSLDHPSGHGLPEVREIPREGNVRREGGVAEITALIDGTEATVSEAPRDAGATDTGRATTVVSARAFERATRPDPDPVHPEIEIDDGFGI